MTIVAVSFGTYGVNFGVVYLVDEFFLSFSDKELFCSFFFFLSYHLNFHSMLIVFNLISPFPLHSINDLFSKLRYLITIFASKNVLQDSAHFDIPVMLFLS